MKDIKTILRLVFPLFALTFVGCTTVRYYPTNFVESLKHPTKFPEVFSSTVKNIEEVAEKNPLGESEDVKITDVGENKNSSMHLVQVRENAEMRTHYHKRHDEVIYVKKGSGIATLDGTRYMIKPGSILQIPSKTVHKFLNTGGEPFVAVSIFSPPFDGRDEKLIKEKKKPERGKKEERRLASKKSEKVVEKEESSVVKETTDKKIKTAMVNPEKISEMKANKSVREERNDETDTEKTSLPAKKPIGSENKKKKKKVVPDEEPTVNIKDMHEKLTKLLELRDEGTISAEEYEEKKDALIKGREIGMLPEPKSPVKKKAVIDAEPVLKQPEKRISEDENMPDEERDTTLSTPSLSGKSEPAVREHESEEEPQTEDKIQMLEEMREEGLISDEDYETKRRQITGESSEKAAESISTADTSKDEKMEELKELYNQGLITEDDYEYKLKELTESETQDISSNISTEKEVENDKLSELNELKEEGLISEEDYEFKKAQLLGK